MNEFKLAINQEPILVLNKHFTASSNVGAYLNDQIRHCDEFMIAVAFLTQGGLGRLIDALEEFDNRNCGTAYLLVSAYQYFTQSHALKGLKRFKNIKSRLIPDRSKYHGKGYLFKKDSQYSLLIGSANITIDGLARNDELNIRLDKFNQDPIINAFKDYFKVMYKDADDLSDAVIAEYCENEKRNKERNNKESVYEITPVKYHPFPIQVRALEEIAKVRSNNERRALLISATGTGKTVIAALDVLQSAPKKLLFVVHRRTIAERAMEIFKQVLGHTTKRFGIYSGDKQEFDADYIFSTVQTLSISSHLERFDSKHFEYIIIDESHHAKANTYEKLLSYFKPKFLLGMTATPDRTDGKDLYELFNNTIAFEMRLDQALESELLTPFNYFGISDLQIDGVSVGENTKLSQLICKERVKVILDNIRKYGSDSGIIRGLVFCSRVEEANALAEICNQKGMRSIAIMGTSSESEREEAIKRIESDDDAHRIELIFTVDIFNEGIDIPKVNLIILLRETQSPIIFIQQLGRGLRKTANKEYLTVLDFIGNYKNNYMIPLALFGNSNDKERLRRIVLKPHTLLPGSCFVQFDKIAKGKILDSINSANLQTKTILKNNYLDLKYKLHRSPMMEDFHHNGERDPYQFISYCKSSYLTFVKEADKEYQVSLPKKLNSLLGHLSIEINDGKKVEESEILLLLITKGGTTLAELNNILKDKYQFSISEAEFRGCVHNLNLQYATNKSKGKNIPIGEIHNYEIISTHPHKPQIECGSTLKAALTNETFKNYLLDSTRSSIISFQNKVIHHEYCNGFIRYGNYTRKDVLRILYWEKEQVGLNIGGYSIHPDKKKCPLFINYHKSDTISATTKYKDKFNSASELQWYSKNNRTKESPDVTLLLNQHESGIRVPLFVKKTQEEKFFYYLGDLKTIPNTYQEEIIERNPVVKISFQLDKKIDSELYDYLVNN
ncbi:MAG: DUF3427 domain-containing protein [Methylacidiphilales bacterium]|nr:DUF3427 domain-containing protein [Candidatus Methylacidiphilales bacterium]